MFQLHRGQLNVLTHIYYVDTEIYTCTPIHIGHRLLRKRERERERDLRGVDGDEVSGQAAQLRTDQTVLAWGACIHKHIYIYINTC